MKTADMNADGSMTITKPKATRARRPQLDEWHPDHPANRYNPPADTDDPDPPPTPTQARASARAKRAAKTK